MIANSVTKEEAKEAIELLRTYFDSISRVNPVLKKAVETLLRYIEKST